MANQRKYFFTGALMVFALAGMVVSVRHFRPPISKSGSDNLKVKGPDHAPIHMVVYSDFQCPACRSAREPIEALRNQFSDAIRLEFRHYPLERNHRWAAVAAGFAECAAQQGKFWEFHDRLFQEQATWSASNEAVLFFAETAQGLQLDRGKLEICLKNPETISRIRRERSMGERQKVQSTPTIFINDRILVGAGQLKEQGSLIVEEELKQLNEGKAAKSS